MIRCPILCNKIELMFGCSWYPVAGNIIIIYRCRCPGGTCTHGDTKVFIICIFSIQIGIGKIKRKVFHHPTACSKLQTSMSCATDVVPHLYDAPVAIPIVAGGLHDIVFSVKLE